MPAPLEEPETEAAADGEAQRSPPNPDSECAASKATGAVEVGMSGRIRAAHILVVYADAKRVPADTTRTKDEAFDRAMQVRARVCSGEPFAEVARTMSDGPSASNGGELGFFRRGMMVQPFEDAAFSLAPGEISDVVESDFGFHVIRRVE